MLPATAIASTPLPAAAPGEPHAALFLALGYMQLPELLACWRVCRRLGEAVAGDPLLWRRVAVERPLSSRVTDSFLLKLTGREEGTLRSLRLDGSSLISDAGLLRVVERNPCITELYVPTCIGLTGDGVLKIIQLLHDRKGNLNRLWIHGISKMTRHHLNIINCLICKGNLQQDGRPHLYKYRVHEVLNTDGEHPIDVDSCPMCTNVRLLFVCMRDGCRREKKSWPQCRDCFYCVARCEKCGGCISLEDLGEVDLVAVWPVYLPPLHGTQ